MAEDHGSRAQERPAKRDRLIDAASQLFYEQGVERTTIADIAAAADVPAGNVYYYFKAKDDIVDAVVSMRIGGIEAMYAALASGMTLRSIDSRHCSNRFRGKPK
jgi:TetR/AcrR family transcriptional repressor of nem operon